MDDVKYNFLFHWDSVSVFTWWFWRLIRRGYFPPTLFDVHVTNDGQFRFTFGTLFYLLINIQFMCAASLKDFLVVVQVILYKLQAYFFVFVSTKEITVKQCIVILERRVVSFLRSQRFFWSFCSDQTKLSKYFFLLSQVCIKYLVTVFLWTYQLVQKLVLSSNNTYPRW